MENQYCLFFKNNRLSFGWIKEIRKNKLVVVPEQGKEFSCSASRVEYIWKGKVISEEKEALTYLKSKASWSIQQSEKIELDIIHELCEPGEVFSLDELAENFLDDNQDGWMRSALYIRLKNDSILFQQRKNGFVARSEEELNEIAQREERKKEADAIKEMEKKWAESLQSGNIPAITSDEQDHWQQFISRIKKALIFLERSQEKEYFCELFHCHVKELDMLEKTLIESLSYTDNAISWGKVVLERSSAILDFDEEEIELVKGIVDQDIWENRFELETKDLRSIVTYTVDNEETEDFDDALSFEVLDDGYIVRVSIADVASFISQDSLLFDKASERISSLYTLKEIYPMFPHDLSYGFFSLVENKERPALTFEFKADKEMEVIDSAVYRAVIKVDRNMSYSEVDAAIEDGEEFWSLLANFCRRHSEARKENGSLEIERQEVKLDISNPESIAIKTIRQDTPASLMIQELAIMSNHLAATFAKNNELLTLFRNQPPYSIIGEIPEGTKPSLQNINIQPARVSLNPEGHSALGLDCYLQITSPIRRFLDLLNQSIIMSDLGSQDNPFTHDQLQFWARQGEEIQKEYNMLERKLLDHWKIKYIAQNKDKKFDAKVVRIYRSGRALVNLVKVQYMTEIAVEGLTENDSFQVVVDSVDTCLNSVNIRQLP